MQLAFAHRENKDLKILHMQAEYLCLEYKDFSTIWNSISETLNYPAAGKMRFDDDLITAIKKNNVSMFQAYFEDTLEILQVIDEELFYKACDEKASVNTVEDIIKLYSEHIKK